MGKAEEVWAAENEVTSSFLTDQSDCSEMMSLCRRNMKTHWGMSLTRKRTKIYDDRGCYSNQTRTISITDKFVTSFLNINVTLDEVKSAHMCSTFCLAKLLNNSLVIRPPTYNIIASVSEMYMVNV